MSKPYNCSNCGAEVADLPMPVLKHQMSHVERRPHATDRMTGMTDEDRLFCPFCGEVFDARDLGLVLKHYEHQVAAGLPAIDLTPD